jgi:hypothetical protein
MVAKYEYDPYGNQSNVAGGYEQPFRFSGKYHDAETWHRPARHGIRGGFNGAAAREPRKR